MLAFLWGFSQLRSRQPDLLISLESKYVQIFISLGFTKAHRYHGMYRFIDDTNAVNENTKLYPKELELKVEHRGKRATFLDLQSWSYNHGHFFILYQIFHWLQTQRSMVIGNKNGKHKSPE